MKRAFNNGTIELMPKKKIGTSNLLLPATVYVVVGATGDLMRRKLVPALYQLHRSGVLPEKFAIVGFSRKDFTDAAFRKVVKSFLPRSARASVDSFLKRFHYQQGQFDDPQSYQKLLQHVEVFDRKWKVCGSALFHLAIPPVLYGMVLQNISRSGLTKRCSDAEGWSRILIEKPFGRDVKSAEKLDEKLARLFKEEQICRVDHYLAKETLQNILTFRFSNSLFEPVWNRDFIERIDIKLLETEGIGTRGQYYDENGALRDVGQNHLLQMLALIAMDHPGRLGSKQIRAARAKLLRHVQPLSFHPQGSVIRGQYEGYTKELHVAPNSKTETYFKVTAHVHNKRWRGVPFYLESGKALATKKTEIVIHFRQSEPCWCMKAHDGHTHQNKLVFKVQPSEGIAIQFWAKKSDLIGDIEPRMFDFNYRKGSGPQTDPYAKLLFDAIRGDQTLFSSTDEVIASWHVVTPLLKRWQRLPLLKYAKGSKL